MQKFWNQIRECVNAPFEAFRSFGTGFQWAVPRRPGEFDDLFLEWGLRLIPLKVSTWHFLVFGVPGSGKTTLIRLFLQSLLPHFPKLEAHARKSTERPRALIYDPKRDMMSILGGIINGLPEDKKNSIRIVNANPFDERCQAWDMARDILTSEDARHFATTLVPKEEKSNNPFWSDAAQELVGAVTLGLVRRKGRKWDLLEMIETCRSIDQIKRITSQDSEVASLAAPFLKDETHFPGIISTLATKLGKYHNIAMSWRRIGTAKSFSIASWFDEGGILLLGSHAKYDESLWPINAVILKMVTDRVLLNEETDLPNTWFILDEFRWMGRVDVVRRLLNQGRSKGASVVLGVQDNEGLIAVYDRHEANEIVGQCGHKIFMRLSGPSAEYAESLFGHTESIIELNSTSQSWSLEGASYSDSAGQSVHVAPVHRAREFSTLPMAGPLTGQIAFISKSSFYGEEKNSLPWEQVAPRLLETKSVVGFISRPESKADELPSQIAQETPISEDRSIMDMLNGVPSDLDRKKP